MKINKERRAWLAGLTDDTQVAIVKSDGTAVATGKVRIWPGVIRVLVDTALVKNFTAATGKLSGAVGDAIRWVAPLTPEHLATVKREERRVKLASRLAGFMWWHTLPVEKVEAVAAILWPEGCDGRP